MNHREILLYGFHFSFFLIFTLAVIRDLFFEHYFNAMVNFNSLSMSFISYYFLHYRRKVKLSGYIVMAIAVIPLYVLIFFNHFENLVIVYVILLPIAAFFLLEFKEAIIINMVIYTILVSMLFYIHAIDPDAALINNKMALINIAFASMFIVFFGIFYHLAVDSSLSALMHSNKQKDILLKEVHHRVKNNLNVTASILALQARGKSDETQTELLRSRSRIEAIAVVHEMLYQQDDFQQIIFNDYVEKLHELIISMFNLNKKVKIIMPENGGLSLPLNTMIQFGIIINEMLTNSIKHTKNTQEIIIEISLQKERETYTFIYKDNGETYVDTQEIMKSSGLGIKLIQLSIQQLDGILKIDADQGLRYQMRFKDA